MTDIKTVMDDVVKRYKKPGVINYTELIAFFSDDKLTEDNFSYIWKRLDANHIKVQMNEDYDDDQIDAEDNELEEIEEEIEELESNINISDDYTDDSVRQYMREAASKPLLTAEEEINLAKLIESGREAEKKIGKDKEKLEKEKDKKKQAQLKGNITKYQKRIDEGKAAMDKLTESNLRLVISISKHYVGRGLPLLDLIQEGNMGLMRASDRFDYHRGYKFSTYATWWIRQAITRGIADQGRTIRLPVHMGEIINRIKKAQKKLTMELSREPSDDEIAKEMDMPLERLREIKKVMAEPVSLDTPVGEEEDSTLGSFIHDETTPDPQEAAMCASLTRQIREALDKLTPRERKIIIMRFGLDNKAPMTLEEVGKEFHVTRERIRQIESKSIRKLRKWNSKKLLGDYIH